nr:uncharacterized protein LOC109155727 isoform X3 [Ipomoea batatas]
MCLKQTKHISSVRQAINMRNRFAATIMPALTSKLLPTLDSSSVVGAGDAAGVTIFGGSGGDKIFLGLGAAGVIGPAGQVRFYNKVADTQTTNEVWWSTAAKVAMGEAWTAEETPRLRSSNSAWNLFSGVILLRLVKEFCNGLKKLTRLRRRRGLGMRLEIRSPLMVNK